MVAKFMAAEVIPLEDIIFHGDRETLDAAVTHAHAQTKSAAWSPGRPTSPVQFGGAGLSMVEHGMLGDIMCERPVCG